MNKAQYHEYLKTPRWKVIADEVKKRAGWKCQVCNSSLDLHTHHRTYDHLGDELSHMDDLICLCSRCHRIFHGHEDTPRRCTDAPKKARKQKKNKKAPVCTFNPFEGPSKSKGDSEGFKRALKAYGAKYDHEGDCPSGEEIKMTKPLWAKMRTVNGGHTAATIDAFNVPKPLKSGWFKRDLLGKRFPRSVIMDALKGREKIVFSSIMIQKVEQRLGIT